MEAVAGAMTTPSHGKLSMIEGGTTNYTLALASQPLFPVTAVPLPDQPLTVDPATLIFTPENWRQPQVIAIIHPDVIALPSVAETYSYPYSRPLESATHRQIARISAPVTNHIKRLPGITWFDLMTATPPPPRSPISMETASPPGRSISPEPIPTIPIPTL